MNKTVQTTPFLRISVALAAGIILAMLVHIPMYLSAICFTIVFTMLVALYQNYRYRFGVLFGFGVHLLFLFLGAGIYAGYNHEPKFFDHGIYAATVLEKPVEKANSYQSLLHINQVRIHDSVFQTDEEVLVYFEKGEPAIGLVPGNIIVFDQSPQLVKNNGNPFEFDYKTFLERKKIYRRVYLPNRNWAKTNLAGKFSLKTGAEKIRLRLLQIYRSQNLNNKEIEILSALTLGYKRELDPETVRTFSAAGAMHVLAVSGLHVGILFMILTFMLGFLKKQKYGRLIFAVAVVSVLWFFAFLTGLSPSVTRATTMFTFWVVGNNLNRRVSIYNSLTGSAFFLLLLNPNNLFEVGFQLSYAAVFGIIYLQPKLEKIVTFRNKTAVYFWKLLTVSVAAQIATFPISLFYFHQFPVYFWVANLFIIPAVTLLIPFGILLLALNTFPLACGIMVFVVHHIISVVYRGLEVIENLPFSVQTLVISPAEFVLLTGAVLSVFVFLNQFQSRFLKRALFFLLLMLSTSLFLKTVNLFRNEIIVYNTNGNTIVHFITGKKNYVVYEKEFEENDYSLNYIRSTVQACHLSEPVFIRSREYEDEYFLMKSGIIAFQNKRVIFSGAIKDVPENLLPVLVINPTKNETSSTGNEQYLYVSTRKNVENEPEITSKIFFTKEKGAFRMSW